MTARQTHRPKGRSMSEASKSRQRLIGALVYATLAVLLVFMQLLPLSSVPRSWTGPDILLGLTLVWATRRPDFLPVGLVIIVFFGADLLLQRPPGLMAALVVVATEALRARSPALRDAPFVFEWLYVAIAIVGITVLNRAVLSMMMVPSPPASLNFIQMVMTIATYPILVLAAHFGFGLYRPAPGEVDSHGQRL